MHPYLERIIGYLGEQDPITVLENSPGKLELLVSQLGSNGLDKSYAPGKWSARTILAQLADVELGMGFRIRQTLAEAKHHIQAFDQDAWARRYARLEPSLALETFRALRSWNLTLFAGFSLEDWLKEAVHPKRGKESIDLMVRFLAGHDLNHLLQLEQILEQ